MRRVTRFAAAEGAGSAEPLPVMSEPVRGGGACAHAYVRMFVCLCVCWGEGGRGGISAGQAPKFNGLLGASGWEARAKGWCTAWKLQFSDGQPTCGVDATPLAGIRRPLRLLPLCPLLPLAHAQVGHLARNVGAGGGGLRVGGREGRETIRSPSGT